MGLSRAKSTNWKPVPAATILNANPPAAPRLRPEKEVTFCLQNMALPSQGLLACGLLPAACLGAALSPAWHQAQLNPLPQSHQGPMPAALRVAGQSQSCSNQSLPRVPWSCLSMCHPLPGLDHPTPALPSKFSGLFNFPSLKGSIVFFSLLSNNSKFQKPLKTKNSL